jgi:DNA polymerase delta subunit 1
MEVFGWHVHDDKPGDTTVIAGLGTLADGRPACVWMDYTPFFYIRKKNKKTTSDSKEMQRLLGAKKCEQVKGKRLYDNPELEKETFFRFYFSTVERMKKASSIAHGMGEVYEADIPVVTRPFHSGLPSCGWIEEPRGVTKRSLTRKDIHETSITVNELKPLEQPPGLSQIPIATWDVEVFSERSTWDDQRFPEHSYAGDCIIQIVTFFSRGASTTAYLAHVVMLAPCWGEETFEYPVLDTVEDWEICVCHSEEELLVKWLGAIATHRPLVFQHFNGLGFDEEYVFRRAQRYGTAMEKLRTLSPLHQCGVWLNTTSMESAAYGANEFKSMEIPGVFHLDLMVSIKREYKLVSYSLNSCGEHFLGERKEDMKPQELFDTYRGDTVEGHSRILRYCIQDVNLTFRLGCKLNFLTNLKEMATATMVPIDYLVKRGQQVKVQSLICNITTPQGFFMRTWPSGTVHGGGYKGAYVLDPHRGPYFRPILTLDFASLYPSIMRAHNMSYETLLKGEKDIQKYKDLGMEIDVIDLGEDGGVVGFVQGTQGICPRLLQDLATLRKEAKKSMFHFEKLAHESSGADKEFYKLQESVWNAKQLVRSHTPNPCYGSNKSCVSRRPTR